MTARYSNAYFQALDEARAHHASAKTYSGKFLRPHAPMIKRVLEETGSRSILDFGCGKGRQYEWVSHGGTASIPAGMRLSEYWGVPLFLYDPAFEPYATPPTAPFDLVICTHVLGSIPTADLGEFFRLLFTFARKAVYIAERIGPVKKQVFSHPELFPRWGIDQWGETVRTFMLKENLLRETDPDVRVWLDLRTKEGGQVLHSGGWL